MLISFEVFAVAGLPTASPSTRTVPRPLVRQNLGLVKLVPRRSGRPAPRIAQVASETWSVLNMSSKHPLTVLQGNIVRFAPDKISINSATALRDIYSARKVNLVKADWYAALVVAENNSANTFSTQDRSIHAYKRRMLSNAFSENALRDMESKIIANIEIWLGRLGEDVQTDGWTLPHNVGPLCNYLVFDILTNLCFGRSFNLLKSTDMRYVAELIPTAVRAIYDVNPNPFPTPVQPTNQLEN